MAHAQSLRADMELDMLDAQSRQGLLDYLQSLLVIDEDDHGRPQRLFYGASRISEPSCDKRFQFATMSHTINNSPLHFAHHHSKVDHQLAHSFHPQLAKSLTDTLPHTPSAASSAAASDADTVAPAFASPVSCAADVKDALPSSTTKLRVVAVLGACVQCCIWLAARSEGLWESIACVSGLMMRRIKCPNAVALIQALWCVFWGICILTAWIVYLPRMFVATLMSLPCEIFGCWHKLRTWCRLCEQVPPQRSVCVCRGHHRACRLTQ